MGTLEVKEGTFGVSRPTLGSIMLWQNEEQRDVDLAKQHNGKCFNEHMATFNKFNKFVVYIQPSHQTL